MPWLGHQPPDIVRWVLIEPITRDGEAQAAPTIGWPLGAGHDIGIIPMLLACQMSW